MELLAATMLDDAMIADISAKTGDVWRATPGAKRDMIFRAKTASGGLPFGWHALSLGDRVAAPMGTRGPTTPVWLSTADHLLAAKEKLRRLVSSGGCVVVGKANRECVECDLRVAPGCEDY
jgi:hypothetical protein